MSQKKNSRQNVCFVPNCKSGNKSYKVKVSMFKPPDDPKRLSEWERNIKRADRRLTKNCVVCALHFEQCFIEHSWKHIINGQVVEIPRAKPKLADDAVPTRFPNAPSYFNKHLPKKRKERNLCDQPPPKKICKIKNTQENLDDVMPTQISVAPDFNKHKPVKCKQQNLGDQAALKTICKMKQTQENSDFDNNLAVYHLLELPKMWSYLDVSGLPNTFHYGRVKFKSAEDCSTLAISTLVRVVQQLDGSAICTMFVRGIVESTTIITTPEELKELLMRADKLIFCAGFNIQPSGKTHYSEFDGAYYSKNCMLISKEKGKLCLHCKYLRTLALKQNSRKKMQTMKHECKLKKRHYEAQKALRTKRLLQKTQQTVKQMKLENESALEQAIENNLSKLPKKQKLMVQACFKAASRKSTNGMIYEKEWIIECNLIRMKSPALYNYLREQQLLALPSDACLRKYLDDALSKH